jgi:hypothetical protein
MVEPHLPANRSEVTEAWLSETLANHPTFAADPIESIELTNLGDGMGQLSELSAAVLHCASGDVRNLVIKLHTEVPSMHALAMTYGYYESEINFYNLLADRIPMRTPQIYLAQFDPTSERVLAIMESFKGWHSPDQLAGATLDEVTIAIDHLAGLTATFWNASVHETYRWLNHPMSDSYASVPAAYAATVDTFLERFSEALPESAAQAAPAISGHFATLMEELAQGNQALAHGDYRVENLFYGPEDEFAVIDWQLMLNTRASYDLAYLLSTNIDSGLRRGAEGELMDRYFDGLTSHGVQDYSRAQLESDYRLALLDISRIPVIGGASCDMSNPRNVALFAAIGSRLFQAIEDWEALDLLPH